MDLLEGLDDPSSPQEPHVNTSESPTDSIQKRVEELLHSAPTSRPSALPLLPELCEAIASHQLDLGTLGQLLPVLRDEAAAVYRQLEARYRTVFPELAELVPNQRTYVRVLRALETGAPLDGLLTREQAMLVAMTRPQTPRDDDPSFYTRELAPHADHHEQLHAALDTIDAHIVQQAHRLAPTVTALVGPVVAAALLSHAGSVRELAQVPACNLAAIGAPRHTSHALRTDASGVRLRGHVWDTPLVQEQPPALQRQALRMLCARLALAARVDATAPDPALANRWRADILARIAARAAPPAPAGGAPLPVPSDAKPRRRAGRRFRAHRNKFRLSAARQLQNRAAFGVPERTAVDSFGEEIGLGLSGTPAAPSAPAPR
ncbi:AaceriADR032Wp [[Ashbya] aceris (nom. inval.)]|nr:AaceriADR032Wp [[Ashbya] aceris (nom. inval.)]